MHGAEADSDDDDDDEYEEKDVQAPNVTVKKVKQTVSSQVTKKIAGTSLPPRKHEPLPPVDLDEALAGEESDEYVTSEVGLIRRDYCNITQFYLHRRMSRVPMRALRKTYVMKASTSFMAALTH